MMHETIKLQCFLSFFFLFFSVWSCKLLEHCSGCLQYVTKRVYLAKWCNTGYILLIAEHQVFCVFRDLSFYCSYC